METLPSELIASVARLLTQQEQHACVCVSRQWYLLFVGHLYRTVHIADRQAMHSFLRALRQTSAAHQPTEPLGHLVREVVLGRGSRPLRPYRANELRDRTYRLGLTPSRWRALARLCPFVELVDFHWTTWLELGDGASGWHRLLHHNDNDNGNDDSGHGLFPWPRLRGVAPFHNSGVLRQVLADHGSCLTRLELTRAVLEHVIDDWQPLLSQTPVLEELTLTSGISFGTLMTGPMLLHLDALLDACPRSLRTLALSMFRLDAAPTATASRRCPPLADLRLYTVEFLTPRPLEYLALSCTALDSLAIGRSVVAFDVEFTKDAFGDALAKVFAANRASLRRAAIDPSWSRLWVLGVLQALRPGSLLELCIGSHRGRLLDPPGAHMDPGRYNAVLSALSPRATTLEMTAYNQRGSNAAHLAQQLTRPLRHACPSLFDLELNGAQQQLALDTILNHLPSLHRLKLGNAHITLQQPAAASTPPASSRLRHCGFHLSHLRAEAFDFLASTCPSLSSLSMTACHYHATLPAVSLNIHMPHHSLQHVSIQAVSAVCELPNTSDSATVHTLGMGKCLALGLVTAHDDPGAAEYYQVSYHRHSFTRHLLPLPASMFPYLAADTIPAHGTESDLEALGKNWFKAHRQQRALSAPGSPVPEKSFGYISLCARRIDKCVFEETVVPSSRG